MYNYVQCMYMYMYKATLLYVNTLYITVVSIHVPLTVPKFHGEGGGVMVTCFCIYSPNRLDYTVTWCVSRAGWRV